MNENRFDGKAEAYAASRPRYPGSLFEYLKEHKIITDGSTVADIGSGTGIFSVQMASVVKKVFAVEPDDGMRAAACLNFKKHKNIVSVNAAAENTMLGSHSVDCVTAAQAFHWFDPNAFKTECGRILKPAGHVVLVWNDRKKDSEIIKRNAEINVKYCVGYQGYSSGMNAVAPEQLSNFFEGRYDIITFENTILCDRNTFIGRSLSSSYAPKEGDAGFENYVIELTKLFDELSHNGTVLYPYITYCYIGTP
ncbi:MAG: class I SAM-dependent methyltransferase [Clostridiales bacterium]|nr:class I SAM-dependent methyltransferase [Clostridiales bacterium]